MLRLSALPAIDHRDDQIFAMDHTGPSNSENVQNHESQGYVRERCMETADHASLVLALIALPVGMAHFRLRR